MHRQRLEEVEHVILHSYQHGDVVKLGLCERSLDLAVYVLSSEQ